MIEKAFRDWLDTVKLSVDQTILANLCIALAKDFDEKTNTSTAAELRKTYLELKRSLGEQGQHDPLEALLKR